MSVKWGLVCFIYTFQDLKAFVDLQIKSTRQCFMSSRGQGVVGWDGFLKTKLQLCQPTWKWSVEREKYGHGSDISLSSTYIETRLKQLSSGLYFSYQTHNMVNVKHLNMQTKHAPVYSKLVKDQWLYILDVYQSSCPQADYNVKCPLYFIKRNI